MFQRARYTEDNWDKIKNPAASLKHDGASFFLTIGPLGESRYFSRRPSIKGGFPERTSQLPHLTSTLLPQLAGNVYNVELIHTGHASFGKEDHPKLSGILNSLPAKSIETQKQEGPVRAVLLDVVHPKISTYGEKLQHMKDVEKAFNNSEVLRSIDVKIGKNAIVDLIDSTRKSGREGVIITSLTEPEETNTRVKVKHVNTYNLRVKRINQEYDIKGNPKESAGSLTVVDSTGKEVADVGTGFSRDLRQEIWRNPEAWVNKDIQVKARTPHRNKLIAPVYNGEPDGQLDMIKSASALQDKLLETLVAKYTAKGINLQKILDNQLFKQLPLEKKVAFIEQIGGPISIKPKSSYSIAGYGVLGGAAAGVVGGAMHRLTMPGLNPSAVVPSIVLGAMGGAVIGGAGGLIRSIMDNTRDKKIQSLANNGLAALVHNSTSSSVGGTPFTGMNRYLGQIEGFVDNKLPAFTYSIAEQNVQ
jgi:hypothetical protein